MNVTYSVGPLASIKERVRVHFVFAEKRSLAQLGRVRAAGLPEALRSGTVTGAFKESSVFFAKERSRVVTNIVIGLGARKSLTPERIRKAAAKGAKEAQRLKAGTCAFVVPDRFGSQTAHLLAVFEGASLSQYRFDAYIQEKKREHRLGDIRVHAVARSMRRPLERSRTIAEYTIAGTYLARDLSNAPGNELYPERLADEARRVAEKHGFDVTVFDENEVESLGMGGLVAVGKGSARPPRFIVLEYGPKTRKPVVLIGKGVTFDTGGISIKPSAGMAEMKMDMGGAAAVVGTFDAVAGLGIPVHLIGLIPAVENMPGGAAQRPGDIIRHLSGKTSEVDNTDAEGRLILADALAYATQFKPEVVIDLATLTGAVVVALGHVAAGMMGTGTAVMKQLTAAGLATHERVWELPLFEEYERLIKSDVADAKNVGGRWAGPITAAMFLKQHIGPYPWVHLDIAGTAMLEENGDYTQKGGSGYGVRLLTEFLRRRPRTRS